MVCSDFAKAFDKVPNKRLCDADQIKAISILHRPGFYFDVDSRMAKDKTRVMQKDHVSEWASFTSGVPQD